MGENITHVVFNEHRVAVTVPLHQFDRGQILVFDNIELPATYRVVFSNGVMKEGKSVLGDENGVRIPDEYFLLGCNIIGWLILQDESSAEVEYVIRIPVRPRSPVSDEETDLFDANVVDQIVTLINDLQDKYVELNVLIQGYNDLFSEIDDRLIALENRVPALGGWKLT